MQARRRLQPERRRHLSDEHHLGLCPQIAKSTRPGTEMNHDLDAAIREDRLGQRIVAGFQLPEALDVSSEIGRRWQFEVAHGAADRSTRERLQVPAVSLRSRSAYTESRGRATRP